jgi:hypothetical protein
MTVEEALAIVDTIVAPERLNSVQEMVFCKCWAGETYQEIAQSSGYDGDYIRIVGSRLWQTLSNATAEKVTKNNIHVVLRHYSNRSCDYVTDRSSESQPSEMPLGVLEFPGGPRPLTCPYYIECLTVIDECYREIGKPGALIRIKAPEKRGKSSLMVRILAHAESLGYETVRLNLQQAEGEVLNDLYRFLRWFCANISQQLKLEPKLDDYWDADLGSKISCTSYLQGYILDGLERPLVIALDEVHRLFEYPAIAQDFLPLLRLWHEEANNLDIWAKFSSIVVYSTEVYIPLDLNQSPFNVGLPIRLPKFDLEQTRTLGLRYGLELVEDGNLEDLAHLQSMVDGHPYLLNLAFYHLARQDVSIETLLKDAPTQTSIYSEHLRSHSIALQNSPKLLAALQEVVMANAAVCLDPILAYQLESMGLVNLDGDLASPSCDLYRLYFRDRF